MHSILSSFLAQTAPEGGGAFGALGNIVPILLMVAVFYFVLLRPQQKQAKKHQEFVSQLQKGQDVVTQGGIIGKVFQVEDKTVTLDLGGGNKVRFVRGQIAGSWSDAAGGPDAKEKK
jgi:preprotein translocase subunit YajC